MSKKIDLVKLRSHELSELKFGHLSHDQMAYLIGGLYRIHPEFDDVCMGASDRIKWLERRVDAFEAVIPKIIPEFIRSLSSSLHSQDCQCTADPIFIVEQKRIVAGLDVDYVDDPSEIVWCCEDRMYFAGDSHFKELETQYQEANLVPDEYMRTGFFKQWDFVQPFFTQAAADAFIAKHGHKFDGEFRVSVESAYRNEEWQQVAYWLAHLPQAADCLNSDSKEVENLRSLLSTEMDANAAYAYLVKQNADRIEALEAQLMEAKKDTERLNFLESMCVEVRKPLLHGSLAMFHAKTISDDEAHKTDLRNQIDVASRENRQ